jgi:hypothetical protein
MLFVFASSTRPGFWMKDMKFPIDIIWINADKEVVGIESNIATSTFPKLFFPEKEISPWVARNGYYTVSAKLGSVRPKMLVHRLIAMAFVDGYSEGLTVNHINGNKLDNRPENLEWITRANNTKHEWETGLVDLRGENAPNHKLTQKQVMHIRKALRLGVSANSLAIISNVNPSNQDQFV